MENLEPVTSTFPSLITPRIHIDPVDVTTDVPDYDSDNCNQYVVQNKTHIIYGGYEGIPENLLINFFGMLFLLSLFTILRKKAWNYGRLALVQKYDNRTKVKHLGSSEYNIWTQLFYGVDPEASKSNPSNDSDSIASYDFNLQLDSGNFSWITALFKIKDEHVLHKSGQDAVHYLSFQRHIIVYMAIVTVVAIGVVLPINFQGTLEGDSKEFSHTTISNLEPSSPYMWVHITLAFLFLPIGIAFTRHHSRLLHLEKSDLDPNSDHTNLQSSVNRTVMITHVPRRSCHKDTLIRHFEEAYPNVEVLDLQFAYCIRDLLAYNKERELAHNSIIYCEDYERETGDKLLMRPYKCGVICGCCDMFGAPKVDALEFYSNLEQCLTAKVETEKVKALQRPTGVAFITLDSVDGASKVLKDHKSVHCNCLHTPPSSSVSGELKPHNWLVRMAPAPSNIYWKNLSVTTRLWWAKALLINTVLFVILFFLTTPAVIINTLDVFLLKDTLDQMSPLLSEFLPTLLLWTTAAILPVLVSYSDQFMSHWTRSAENHSVMRKTFLFLLFMVIILPSLGLTSAKAFVEWITNPTANNGSYRWKCIFLPDNGAFFVNYIITSAFIGTSLELIRFPELFMYMIRLALARSKAESASVRRAILYEFQFGVQYAWMLLIFAMTVIYSLSCPLVTPFGLLYMVLKHLVDKYNIYFAYGPSRISKNIHATAVNFVIISIVLLQISLLFFSVVRQGVKKARSIYSLTLLSITILVFISHVAFHWFKDISPIDYKTVDDRRDSAADSTVEGGDVDASHPSTSDGEMRGKSGGDVSYFVPDVLKEAGVEPLNNRRNKDGSERAPPRGPEVSGPWEEERLYDEAFQVRQYGSSDSHYHQHSPKETVVAEVNDPPRGVSKTLPDSKTPVRPVSTPLHSTPNAPQSDIFQDIPSKMRKPPMPPNLSITGQGDDSILDSFGGDSGHPSV